MERRAADAKRGGGRKGHSGGDKEGSDGEFHGDGLLSQKSVEGAIETRKRGHAHNGAYVTPLSQSDNADADNTNPILRKEW